MQTDETVDRLTLVNAIKNGGAVPHDAAFALDQLLVGGYGENESECIYRALTDAWEAWKPDGG
jgi:hypothetical protein